MEKHENHTPNARNAQGSTSMTQIGHRRKSRAQADAIASGIVAG
jgi:hypothetical protein